MPAVTSQKTLKSTSRISSRISRTGRLTGRMMTAEEFDRKCLAAGMREATPEESRMIREAQARAGSPT